jgi:hypothetical protein
MSYRQSSGLVSLEQMSEIAALCASGAVDYAKMEDFLRPFRVGRSSSVTADSSTANPVDYATRFTAAVAAGKYDYVSPSLTATEFPESVFGTPGEGLVLAQPRPTDEGYWTEAEIDAWLVEKRKEGFEAATLADCLAYGAEHPDEQRNAPIVASGSLSRTGCVAFLGLIGDERSLYVGKRVGGWNDYCRFLLRKVQPKS